MAGSARRRPVPTYWPALSPLATSLGILTTFHLFLAIGPFFVARDIAHGIQMVSLLFVDFGSYSDRTYKDMLTLMFFCWPLLAMQVAQYATGDHYIVGRLVFPARVAIYLLMTILLIANGADTQREFIYFQF